MDEDEEADLEPRAPYNSAMVDEESSETKPPNISKSEDEEDYSAWLVGIEEDFELDLPPSKMAKQVIDECVSKKPSWFGELTTSPDRRKAARGVVPENTEASTRWAMKNYNAWAKTRSLIEPDNPVPHDLLSRNDPELVCKWLCCFVLETRKEDGSEYPPSTIRSLVSGINQVIKSNNMPFSVLDKGITGFMTSSKPWILYLAIYIVKVLVLIEIVRLL